MKDNTKIRLRLSKQLFESIAAEVISEAKKHDMSGGAYTEAVKMPKDKKPLKKEIETKVAEAGEDKEKIQEIEPVTATLAAVGSALTAAAVYDIAKIMKTQNLTGIKGFIKAAKQLRRSDTNPMTGGDVN